MKAKFKCESITHYEHSKKAKLRAVYSDKDENAGFTKFTPSGELEILIDNSAPAADFLQVSKSYYLDFTEAPE